MEASNENPVEGRPVELVPLESLLLDEDNPRFGLKEHGSGQTQILDHIVSKFGANDVLSSIAVNGYFEAEPLVCRRRADSGQIVVVEGNRRLAACLVIAGEPRARNQEKRTQQFRALWEANGRCKIDPVPAIVFEEGEHENALLSYLGVRHIASSQPWDSYAKAAWVAKVVKAGDLDVESVAQMIGDQHRTVNRLLQGYYVVEQLVNEGKFIPQNSNRKGRGSVTEYPFSWVYTVLDYAAVRNFLSIPEGAADANPLPPDKLDSGGLLLRAMFGDRRLGRSSAVEDSRQLGALATILSSADKVQLLEGGKTVAEIEAQTKPIGQRLSSGLGSVRDTLRDLIAGLSEQNVDEDTALGFVEISSRVRRMAVDLETRLKHIAFGKDGED